MQGKAIAIVIMVLILAVGAWAGTEKVLYNFTGGSDGAFPFDAGRLARDSSGILYGTTVQGGKPGCGGFGCGVVFALTPNGIGGWTESVLYSFTGGSDGGTPYDRVIRDGSGTLYGTTVYGGSSNCGTAFALSGTTLSTLHSFTCGADGGNPNVALIRDKGGNLYGTASGGGAKGYGVAYQISNAGTFSVLYNFCSASGCIDGSLPSNGLVMDNKGNLFGMTERGGRGSCNLGCGILFKLSKSARGWKETVMHSFAGYPNDGAYPVDASLILSTQKIGKITHSVIFGVTQAGGNTGCSGNGCGTVFELIKSTTGYKFSVLYNFTGSGGDGWNPVGTLSKVKGNLFGTTDLGGGTGCGGGGCGTVFKLTHSNQVWSETVVYSFTGSGDGGEVTSGLVADPSGNLYGVAQVGGSGYGVVYEVIP